MATRPKFISEEELRNRINKEGAEKTAHFLVEYCGYDRDTARQMIVGEQTYMHTRGYPGKFATPRRAPVIDTSTPFPVAIRLSLQDIVAMEEAKKLVPILNLTEYLEEVDYYSILLAYHAKRVKDAVEKIQERKVTPQQLFYEYPELRSLFSHLVTSER